MARPRQWPPSVYHHPNGRDRIRIAGRDYWLGKTGTETARKEYARLCVLLAGDQLPQAKCGDLPPISVGDLVAAFMEHAETFYRDSDGKPTSELTNFQAGLKPLLRRNGGTPAAEFGPLALKDVLREMVRRGWMRSSINRQLVRIRTVFRWAESEQLIEPGVYATLCTVRGLRPGEQGCRDKPPVLPVPEADLERTLPHLSPPQVRGIIDLLLLTGARPGEICRMTAEAIDRSGRVEIARGIHVELTQLWAYTPRQHKTRHRGHGRIVLLGPKAQQVLAPWLLLAAPGQYLFRPARGGRGRPQAGRYSREALLAAGHRGCDRAGVPRWAPGQLRHNAATRLVAEFGWDVARVILGHRSVEMTKQYAINDWKAAAEAMSKAG